INMCNFFTESTKVMESGSFQLRQWSSNSQKLMQKVKSFNVQNDDIVVKVLGIVWNTVKDTLSFGTVLKWDDSFCKRSVLAASNSVFDPMGFIAPVCMQNKLFLQKLWKLDLSWETDFSNDTVLTAEWRNLLSDCSTAVQSVAIPRELKVDKNTELHVFCDASATSYGACIYILNPSPNPNSRGNCKLVFAKGKIKPKNTVDSDNTIPKLELTAMLVGAKLVKTIQNALSIDEQNTVFLWSDATVVLQWLSSPDIDSAYVHRRVVAIREACPGAILMHVCSKDNPADIITRTIQIKKFITNDLWWHGPPWLVGPSQKWPTQQVQYNLHPPLYSPQSINANVAIVEAFNTSFHYKDRSIQTLVQVSMIDRYSEIHETSFLKFFNTYDFRRSMRVLILVFRLAHSSKYHQNLKKPYGNIYTSPLGKYQFAKLKAILIM
ncbi:unnamed protein product, partial [Meganyctiphanes norvegica]